MRFIFTIIIMIFTSTASYAASCNDLEAPGMTDSQLIDLKKKCTDMTSSVPNNPAADTMAEYAELGQKYGVAITEVAKSIGTTANELAQTPVGKFMLFMVAYKVMGDTLIGVLGGIIWFFTMIPLWIYIFHKTVLSTRNIDEHYDSTSGKLSSRKLEPINWDGSAGAISITMLFVMFIIWICGFFMIF